MKETDRKPPDSTAHELAIYKSVFDATSNAVLIVDGAGCIVQLNPAAQRIFAARRPLGRSCLELLGLSRLPVEGAPQLLTLAEGSFNLQLQPLFRTVPGEAGAVLILSDISSLVAQQRDLEHRVVQRDLDIEQSRAIINSVFQTVGQGILLLDDELDVIDANAMATELFGVPLEVLAGGTFTTLTDEAGVQLVQQHSREIAPEEVHVFELTGCYVDGRSFPCLVTMTCMELEGQPCYPLIVSDISRRKEMEAGLVRERQQAEEMNVTLRHVMSSIEEQRRELEQRIATRIRSSILPGLGRAALAEDRAVQAGYLALVKEQLLSLTGGFETPLDGALLRLTRTEMRICQFIQAGLSGKEIGTTMNISFETVQSHRKNIRRKLGLRGQGINLYAFLAGKNLGAESSAAALPGGGDNGVG